MRPRAGGAGDVLGGHVAVNYPDRVQLVRTRVRIAAIRPASGEFRLPTVRPYWKGYLKLALVSCPIALYTASSSSRPNPASRSAFLSL